MVDYRLLDKFFKLQCKDISMAAQVTEFERYAIFQTGGKQYQAIEGKTIAVEKLPGEAGTPVEFSDVLFRKLADDAFEIGQPTLNGAIKASIVKQTKGPKLIIFRFKRRKKSRVKKGHRQQLTVIRIESLGAGTAPKKAAPKKAETKSAE
jgi:large subunit ribosomal protein L21